MKTQFVLQYITACLVFILLLWFYKLSCFSAVVVQTVCSWLDVGLAALILVLILVLLIWSCSHQQELKYYSQNRKK